MSGERFLQASQPAALGLQGLALAGKQRVEGPTSYCGEVSRRRASANQRVASEGIVIALPTTTA